MIECFDNCCVYRALCEGTECGCHGPARISFDGAIDAAAEAGWVFDDADWLKEWRCEDCKRKQKGDA